MSPSLLTPSLSSCSIPSKYVRDLLFFLLLITHLQNSFDALGLYIQSQKALLARTQSDVDRLRLLREQAATDPFDASTKRPFDHVQHARFIDANHNSTKMSSALIINLTSPRRFKTRSIGIYLKDKVRRLRLPLYFLLSPS